jgi:hypothetical protein
MTGAKMQSDFGIEAFEESKKFPFAESLKFSPHQIRYFWLGNAKQFANFALFQVTLFQEVKNLNPYFATGKKFLCIL